MGNACYKKKKKQPVILEYDASPRPAPYPRLPPPQTAITTTTTTGVPPIAPPMVPPMITQPVPARSPPKVIVPAVLQSSLAQSTLNTLKRPQYSSLANSSYPVPAPQPSSMLNPPNLTITSPPVPRPPSRPPSRLPSRLPQSSNFGMAQPIVINQSEPIEIGSYPIERAQQMQYSPVNVRPVLGPGMDLDSNYAMESGQVGGVQTIVDPRLLDYEMETGHGHPNKVYTYTYGNMMSAGALARYDAVGY